MTDAFAFLLLAFGLLAMMIALKKLTAAVRSALLATWEWWSGGGSDAAAKCDSLDSIRGHAAELLDAIESYSKTAWDNGDTEAVCRCEALCEYLRKALRPYIRISSVPPSDTPPPSAIQ